MSVKQEREKVENPTVAKALAYLMVPSIPLKLNRGSDTGRPDDLFLIPYGRPLFIEFKWEDEPLAPKQIYWHRILRKQGYEVQVHNNPDEALAAIAIKVVAAALHEAGCQVSAGAWRCDINARSRIAEDKYYARSIQFLEEAGCSEQDARRRAAESVLSGLARRNRQVEGLQPS